MNRVVEPYVKVITPGNSRGSSTVAMKLKNGYVLIVDKDLNVLNVSNIPGELLIADDGTLVVQDYNSPEIPYASRTEAGLVKVGDGLSIDDLGVLSTTGVLRLSIDSLQAVNGPILFNNAVRSSKTPVIGSDLANKEYVDTKQEKFTPIECLGFSTSGESKVLILKINSNDKILSQSSNGLLTNLKLDYDKSNKKLRLLGKDNQLVSDISINNEVEIDSLDKVLTKSINGLLTNLSLVYDTELKQIKLVGKNNELISTVNINQFVTSNNISINSTTLSNLIPNDASEVNKLTTEEYVQNLVQTNSANFRGSWSTWADVPTDTEEYPADSTGNKIPDNNDYLIVGNANDYPFIPEFFKGQIDEPLNILSYGNDKYLAGTINGILISNDGLNWNSTDLSSYSIYGLFYGNDKYLAGTNQDIYYSLNGSQWIKTNSNITYVGNFIYTENRYIASSNSNIYYSLNGINWTSLTRFTNYPITSLCYNDGIILAATDGDGIYYSTDNGNSWIKSTTSPDYANSLCYGNGIFTTGNYYSDDGINWIEIESELGPIITLSYGDGKFIAGCNDYKGVWYSFDGITWNKVIFEEINALSSTFGNNIFIVSCEGGDFYYTKPTGSWRFRYVGTWDDKDKSGWTPEYLINNNTFNKSQLDSINSGINEQKVKSYDQNVTDLNNLSNTVTQVQDNVNNLSNNIGQIQNNIVNLSNNKVNKVPGKDLSTNDFTNEDKSKLNNIESNAQVNIVESVTVNGILATINNKNASVNIDKLIADSQGKVYAKVGNNNKPIATEEYVANIVGDINSLLEEI